MIAEGGSVIIHRRLIGKEGSPEYVSPIGAVVSQIDTNCKSDDEYTL